MTEVCPLSPGPTHCGTWGTGFSWCPSWRLAGLGGDSRWLSSRVLL